MARTMGDSWKVGGKLSGRPPGTKQNHKESNFMQLNFYGLLLAVCTFLIIGICHPIVIKTEYYFGTRPWVAYLIIGLG